KINQQPRDIQTYFTINKANNNNLKELSVNIPKNVLVSICGVSGSGKSSLMLEAFPKTYTEAIMVGQGMIGISNRSTLATYMGIMDAIRNIFSRETGQPAGLFSFNSIGACPVCHGKGFSKQTGQPAWLFSSKSIGAWPGCHGQGVTKPDVAFADPVTIRCEACGGSRYSNKALSYRYQHKNIVEVLDLTIDEAVTYLTSPTIIKKIRTLQDVGLGYLTLGQSTSSLSGGELQRLKLASHLKKEGQVYLLDEPSFGLHTKDNERLLEVFQNLVNNGNSVIIV